VGPQMNSHSYIKNRKNEDIIIYINGDLVHRNNAKISVFDSGFLLGDGVWEGIRLHKSRLVFIEEHLNRLFESAEGLSIELPFSSKDIEKEIYKVLDANHMTDDVHIRLIISRGDKITPYQNPKANIGPINFVIIPEYKKTDPSVYTNGIKIGMVPNIRPSKDIQNTHYNTLSKLNCILASIEANKRGFDEGIMKDLNNNISTCNSTNLFFIKDKKIITSTGEFCLNGITRSKVIEICHENKITCKEKNFKFKDIESCEEAFVTGTFAGVIPVSILENRKIESHKPSSITSKIRNLYLNKIESYIN
tara:strand:+ start:738 stop:1655 length:918 start_codon:yes stop_codon:yes gene_type:complete